MKKRKAAKTTRKRKTATKTRHARAGKPKKAAKLKTGGSRIPYQKSLPTPGALTSNTTNPTRMRYGA